MVKVRKRDGKVVEFNKDRIKDVLEKAFKEDRNRVRLSVEDKQKIQLLTDQIEDRLLQADKKTLDIEFIQDCVETQLMASQEFSTAKKYILYREDRRRNNALREQVVSNAATFKQMFSDTQGMQVIKRDGSSEPAQFDKILYRITTAAEGLKVDPSLVAQKVVAGIHDGIRSTDLDFLAAETAAVMTDHSDYLVLAARLEITRLHKATSGDFFLIASKLHKNNMLADDVHQFISDHKDQLQQAINYDKDKQLTYFGLKTLQGRKDKPAYLFHVDEKIVERPQDLFMRVACGICCGDLEATLELYGCLSNGEYVHATPTLFNAGTKRPQMSSCFLVAMEDDSIDGIYNTRKDIANISKWAGGIGLHVHNIRAKNSKIRGTNGRSDGLVPMLRTFDADAAYVNQGGKRKGSIAIYIEPWHADIQDVLNLPLKHGKEELRARNLFYAIWNNDLFMQRVRDDKDWSLMCPDECPGLSDVYGEQFEKLYTQYESEGKSRKVIRARDLWLQILQTQMETGLPYITYKDASNKKSNQKNLGTIKSSNLCTEIIEYSSADESAVCNLASICLAAFVNKSGTFNYKRLHKVVKIATTNLNRVIDRNWYPTEKTKRSNEKHRPIGLGVNGLADVFFLMDIAFDSEEARETNKLIFETIYHASVEQSMELAKKQEKYKSFEGSPASQGVLQFDMWNVSPSDRYDWDKLREQVKQYGLRNSLLVAPMPTASTSQIMGWNECFEPVTSNLYKRSVLSGEFILINKYLINDLERLNLWNKQMHDQILLNNGSVQQLDIPDKLKQKYKTAWELSQKTLIDMSADRGAYICQSQSLNLFVAQPTLGTLNSMHFYAWEKGLKTGCYYLRSKPSTNAQQVTTSIQQKSQQEIDQEALLCSLENPEACDMCTS